MTITITRMNKNGVNGYEGQADMPARFTDRRIQSRYGGGAGG
jgi:hypothetical protein